MGVTLGEFLYSEDIFGDDNSVHNTFGNKKIDLLRHWSQVINSIFNLLIRCLPKKSKKIL